jgi:imidazolonepropionase-like amidohydrolase
MTIAFEGVSVVPMDSERVLADQTVVVDGDRISWIGAAATADVPADAQRVDGRGKYLIPGLADMHSHPADEDDLLLLVTHGVTTIRNLFGMPRHVRWRERVAAGELLGPRILTSGPIVDGRPPRSNGNLAVVTREDAITAVERTKRGGYDCVKVYDQLTPEAYRWVVDAAHERDLPVDGHIPFQVGLDGVLDAGQRSIEHLYGYPQALQPSRGATVPHDLGQLRKWLFEMAQNADFERMPELAGRTLEAGTWNCATLIVRTRWTLDPADLAALPELRYLSPAHVAEARYFFGHYPKEPERFAVRDFNAAVLRGLKEAGAGIMIGTDAFVPGIVYGVSVHQELQAFVDAGLSPFETLRAATTGPAEFLGEAGEWGQVTAGSYADLVLLDANPLADIANTNRRAGVMARGRWLPSSEIDDLLANLAARRQNPPLPSLGSAGAAIAADAEPLMFAVSWAGHSLGEDQVVYADRPDGGRHLQATTRMNGFEYDVGVYRSSVEIDAAGVDQSGSFEFQSDDGVDRVEMTRVDGAVHVRHSEPTAGAFELTVPDPDATTLFGRPHAALYVRLAERLAGLAVGDEADVRIVAAGLPADMFAGEATMHAVRMPDEDSDNPGPRYVVEFRRPNWRTSALLVCDHENRPIGIELGSDMAYWHNNTGTEQPDDESIVRMSR